MLNTFAIGFGLLSGPLHATIISSYGPQVATIDSGNSVAVYLAQEDTGQVFVKGTVFVPGTGWTTPVTLSSSTGSAFHPLVTVDIASGHVLATWCLSDLVTGINYIEAVDYPINGSWGATGTVTNSTEDVSLGDQIGRVAGTNKSIVYSAYVDGSLVVRSAVGTFGSNWDSSELISN